MDKFSAAVKALVLADCGNVDGLRHLAAAEHLDVNTPIEAPPSSYAAGCVPLHYACRSGHVAVVTYLLKEQHADPCVTNKKGWNALTYAVSSGNTAVVACLKESVPQAVWWRLQAQHENEHSWTPCDIALRRQMLGILDILEPDALAAGCAVSREGECLGALFRPRLQGLIDRHDKPVFLRRYALASEEQAAQIEAFAASLDAARPVLAVSPATDTVTGASVELRLSAESVAPAPASAAVQRVSVLASGLCLCVTRL